VRQGTVYFIRILDNPSRSGADRVYARQLRVCPVTATLNQIVYLELRAASLTPIGSSPLLASLILSHAYPFPTSNFTFAKEHLSHSCQPARASFANWGGESPPSFAWP
jgi:hypothetical protein